MKINKTYIKVSDLFEGWKDSQEEGVVAYGGRLDVRPKYQREFVYKDEQRNAVIDTVMKHFPLNTMYWVKTSDDHYEVLDGQQRTISICQYLSNDFSVEFSGNRHIFRSLPEDVKKAILDYELDVYVCEGGDAEKLEWFKTINIAGEKLTDQEIRNAVYSGAWVTEAKRYFSKTKCAAFNIGEKYVKAVVNRQELLEKALMWIADSKGVKIDDYMSHHKDDVECSELWDYYRGMIRWIETTFPHYYREMKGVDWGTLYNEHKDFKPVVSELEEEISRLMKDEDVTNRQGIFRYVLTHDERWLSIRAFNNTDRQLAYAKQNGVCPICGKHYEIEEMEADHIVPWSKGGKTIPSNCQMLCKKCNKEKSNH